MEKLNYQFKDTALLELALTQSGIDNQRNNERLEFLGDRVLGLAVASMLYEMFPSETEGELARRHAFLVSTDTLADMAIALGLDTKIRHGHMTAGRSRHMIANAMEAVLGAIFLDGGFGVACKLIQDMWRERATRDVVAPKDAKTALQELVHRHAKNVLPVYEYLSETGAVHKPVFTVRVTALGMSATARGASKKEASTNAAAELLKILAIENNAD